MIVVHPLFCTLILPPEEGDTPPPWPRLHLGRFVVSLLPWGLFPSLLLCQRPPHSSLPHCILIVARHAACYNPVTVQSYNCVRKLLRQVSMVVLKIKIHFWHKNWKNRARFSDLARADFCNDRSQKQKTNCHTATILNSHHPNHILE